MKRKSPDHARQTIPTLVAHRGFLHRYPENSWPALKAAARAGACWIECDVQMCADGSFLLLHDADFRRTGADPRSPFALDARTSQSISVHCPQTLGERFAPTPPPRLEAVLDWLATQEALRLMVEIKRESLQHFGHEPVIEKLVRALQAQADRCRLISFDRKALALARRLGGPEIGWVLPAWNAHHQARASELAPASLICNQKRIPPGASLWPGDWEWMVYDILDADTALALAARGVKLVETGDIEQLLADPRLAPGACPRDA